MDEVEDSEPEREAQRQQLKEMRKRARQLKEQSSSVPQSSKPNRDHLITLYNKMLNRRFIS